MQLLILGINLLKSLLLLSVFIVAGIASVVVSILDLVLRQRRPLQVLHYSEWRGEAFARTWKWMAFAVKLEADSPVPALYGSAKGVVLEVGPGSGEDLRLFDKTKVQKFYGFEPCRQLHGMLRESITKAGLKDVYEIVPLPAQSGERYLSPIEKDGVDTIISKHVFCQVDDQEETFRSLHKLLKPGGQLIVYEHVRNESHALLRFFQDLISIVFPIFLQNCKLNRQTEATLRKSCDWASVELVRMGESSGPMVLVPHVYGRLIKATLTDSVPEAS